MSFLYTLVLARLTTLWHLRLRIRIKHAVVCLSSCYALRPPTSHIVVTLSLYLSLIPTRFSLAKTTRTTTMSNINEPKFIRQMDVLAEGTRQGGGDKETASVSRDMKGEGEKGGAKRSLKWEAKSIKLHLLANSFKSQKPEMHTQCKHHPVPPTHTHTLPVTSTHTYSRVLDTLKCPGHKMCCETRCMRISHFGSF